MSSNNSRGLVKFVAKKMEMKRRIKELLKNNVRRE
jgi:hypothetical protein